MKNYEVLISVIIPVYNVECYLVECVQSIINQTYSNLEIILVDDGSTDASPRICDAFAQKDKRIIVIHKKNEGVSAARNSGIEIAKGEYIGFVDSDDFIDSQMYEKLIAAFSFTQNVGITSCLAYRFNDSSISSYRPEIDIDSIRIVSHVDYEEKIIAETISYTCWNKLYKRNAINAIRFRQGRLNEDFMFNYDLSQQILLNGSCIVEIPERLYYYRCTPNSYTGDTKTMVLCLRDMIVNLKEIRDNNHSQEIKKFLKNKYNAYLLAINAIMQQDRSYEKDLPLYRDALKSDVSYSEIAHKWGVRHKVALLIAKYIPKMFVVKKVYSFCFKYGLIAPFV